MTRPLLGTDTLKRAFDDAVASLKKKDPTRVMSLAALLQQVGDNTESDLLVLAGITLGQFSAAVTQLGAFAAFDTTGGLAGLVDQSLKTGAESCGALGKQLCSDGPPEAEATLAAISALSRLNLRLLNRLQIVQQFSQLGPAAGPGNE